MDKLDQRFELVMSEKEKEALEALADRDGVSKGHILRNMLRRVAKRRGLWDEGRV